MESATDEESPNGVDRARKSTPCRACKAEPTQECEGLGTGIHTERWEDYRLGIFAGPPLTVASHLPPDVLAEYHRVSGYDLSKPSPPTGTVETHGRSVSSPVKKFLMRAKAALAKDPKILMQQFIDDWENHDKSPLMRLDEEQLTQALLNVGCDLRCGSCAETFFSGHTSCMHTCARASKPQGRVLESLAEARKHVIERLNWLDEDQQNCPTREALLHVLCDLQETAGAKNNQLLIAFATETAGEQGLAYPLDKAWAQDLIAHARGYVLALQLMNEGAPANPPGPFQKVGR